ncbi:NAD(P)H-dependent glycerol-3-phosphate dehydrogenase [Opitutus sp. GAS368]|uniref:NAD(P)H-dependent glycerol-3-phosphate dehydrogenase n=1 Tax=Opitutus sp. GAS368 TaxID=1882749 RepID=UPI000879973C|nr:NAD(P)H-dependent glycerol-3-phosphate dehydrogenase [Opitutus sp. GAS368]SDR86787.1 glycerol-3-phosphate dehydrogenase (NAD(P)+) [Opitutus sp. GAS368]
MSDPRPLNFTIIGAGAWGTAMAVHLARRGQQTTLVTRRAEHAAQLRATHENRDYLPGIRLPESLVVTQDLRPALLEADVALIACPSQSLRAWCEQMRTVLHDTSRLQLFLSLVKGLEIGTHLRPSEMMAQVLPGLNCGTLTGPTNAAEVARGLPAAMVMAAQRTDEFVPKVQAAMSGSTLRIYISDDLAGAEYGASLKNIYAIAAGLCDGQRLGDNAKAALLTRAVTEMVRVGAALGAKPETFYGLSGFGDLVATSHGAWSRNREFGEKIGAGKSVAELLAGRKTVVEGHRTTEALHGLCQERGITAPILTEVYAILYQDKKPTDALHALMTRELKRETAAPFAKK